MKVARKMRKVWPANRLLERRNCRRSAACLKDAMTSTVAFARSRMVGFVVGYKLVRTCKTLDSINGTIDARMSVIKEDMKSRIAKCFLKQNKRLTIINRLRNSER